MSTENENTDDIIDDVTDIVVEDDIEVVVDESDQVDQIQYS